MPNPRVRYVDGVKTVPCGGCGERIYFPRNEDEPQLARNASDKQPHSCPPEEAPR